MIGRAKESEVLKGERPQKVVFLLMMMIMLMVTTIGKIKKKLTTLVAAQSSLPTRVVKADFLKAVREAIA